MSKLINAVVWRAIRSAAAIWVASALAHNVWYAPVILAVGKALRDKFPGKVDWLPV